MQVYGTRAERLSKRAASRAPTATPGRPTGSSVRRPVSSPSAALAACAQLRGARYGQILYSADTLAGDEHDIRGWGHATRDTALLTALDAAVLLADTPGGLADSVG